LRETPHCDAVHQQQAQAHRVHQKWSKPPLRPYSPTHIPIQYITYHFYPWHHSSSSAQQRYIKPSLPPYR
jgi:hypothetical protein